MVDGMMYCFSRKDGNLHKWRVACVVSLVLALNGCAFLAPVERVVALEIVVDIVCVPRTENGSMRPILLAPHGINAERQSRWKPAPAAVDRGAPASPVAVVMTPQDRRLSLHVNLVCSPVAHPLRFTRAVDYVMVVVEGEDTDGSIAKAGATGAWTNGDLIIFISVGSLYFACRWELVGCTEAICKIDGIAIQTEATSVWSSVYGIISLDVFGIHGHETQNQQIHTSGHYGQAEQDEDQWKSNVTWPVSQGSVVLSCQRNGKTVIFLS